MVLTLTRKIFMILYMHESGILIFEIWTEGDAEYVEEKEILCILFLPIKSVLDTEIRYNRENSTHPV